MISKKFEVVIEEFGKQRGFTPEETANFKIYINELFQGAQDAMRSKQYDYIVFVCLGTFFLKVWTVYRRLTYFKKETSTGLSPKKNEFRYRKLLAEQIKMQKVYDRMTENFLKKKIRLMENKEARKEKKLTKKQMIEMFMDDVEDSANQIESGNTNIITESDNIDKNELDRDTETSLGE